MAAIAQSNRYRLDAQATLLVTVRVHEVRVVTWPVGLETLATALASLPIPGHPVSSFSRRRRGVTAGMIDFTLCSKATGWVMM